MWNALKQSDGAELFDELKTLGFEKLELSRHLTPDQVEQLKPYLRENPLVPSTTFVPSFPERLKQRQRTTKFHFPA